MDVVVTLPRLSSWYISRFRFEANSRFSSLSLRRRLCGTQSSQLGDGGDASAADMVQMTGSAKASACDLERSIETDGDVQICVSVQQKIGLRSVQSFSSKRLVN